MQFWWGTTLLKLLPSTESIAVQIFIVAKYYCISLSYYCTLGECCDYCSDHAPTRIFSLILPSHVLFGYLPSPCPNGCSLDDGPFNSPPIPAILDFRYGIVLLVAPQLSQWCTQNNYCSLFWQADAFIAMPGGLGTMEELTEILTWLKLRLHSKPVGILNCGGYYDHFLQWVS